MTVRALNLSDDAATQVQADALPEYLVVSRPAFQPQVERVDTDTFRLLVACREGRTLADIAASDEPGERNVAEALPELIARRWIAGFALDRAAADRAQRHA